MPQPPCSCADDAGLPLQTKDSFAAAPPCRQTGPTRPGKAVAAWATKGLGRAGAFRLTPGLAGALAVSLLLSAGVGPARSEPADHRLKAAWADPLAPSPGKPESIGSYTRGCLAGGAALAADGRGHSVLRRGRNRFYGHPSLIEFVSGLGRAAASAGLGRVLVGDLSQPRGGPMAYGHASHQIGLDADIRFALHASNPPSPAFREDGHEVSMLTPDRKAIDRRRWTERQVRLLRQAARDPRVERIFVHPLIKRELCRTLDGRDRDWLGTIRPWYGHHAHFHVRLRCPPDSPNCRPQAPVAAGNGCGAPLQWWFSDAARPSGRRAPPDPYADLPAACARVLAAP